MSKYFFIMSLSFLLLMGCGTAMYVMQPEVTKQFTVSGVTYDDAFNKAIRTATEMGLTVATSNKDAGTFVAVAHGVTELSELNFFLEPTSQGDSSGFIRSKSSKGQDLVNTFITGYRRYVTIQ